MVHTPPPAPGLVSRLTEEGRWLFRWRSYVPLLPLVYIVVAVSVDPVPAGDNRWAAGLWTGAGMVLGLAGLALRGWTVGRVPMGTSGRGTKEMRADSLNREGTYSVLRHPLYAGNLLLWLGVAAVSGRPSAILVSALVFWIYYERIMMAEERFLFERFGEAFGRWASSTPAFLPRLGGWSASPHPLSIRYVLGRDYQALYGFVAATTVVAVARSLAGGDGWVPETGWVVFFLAGTGAYLVLHTLKRRTRLLEAPDR